jgi:hypothetical protein
MKYYITSIKHKRILQVVLLLAASDASFTISKSCHLTPNCVGNVLSCTKAFPSQWLFQFGY